MKFPLLAAFLPYYWSAGTTTQRVWRCCPGGNQSTKFVDKNGNRVFLIAFDEALIGHAERPVSGVFRQPGIL
jgi:hypothetical protein